MMGVKARCKNCGQEALADQFKLHYLLKMMVCPTCFSGKGQKVKEVVRNEPAKKEQPPRPPGWDAEDEYLEKITRLRKMETQARFSPQPGSSQVKCTCANCKYIFKYDPVNKIPHTCPYCNEEVPRLKTSHWG